MTTTETPSFDVLERLVGATPDATCRELYDLAAQVPADQAIVEIGVYKARSACWLAAGAKSGHGARVFAHDPWDLPGDRKTYLESVHGRAHREGFTDPATRLYAEQTVRDLGLDSHCRLVRAFSVDAADTWPGIPIGLLYIDGDHRRAGVQADFDSWAPHCASGAVVAFDDYEPPFTEVIAVVDELAAAGRITGLHVLHNRLAVGTVA